jgi:hypothetical protein
VWKNGFPWRWRRSNSGRVRQPKGWQARFFDSLRQRSHCLRGGQGQTASWQALFSLRRPPRRAGMGVREIALRQTLLRRSRGNKSTAWSVWRSLVAILTKAKNTKCCHYNGFLLRFSGNYEDTPHIKIWNILQKSLHCCHTLLKIYKYKSLYLKNHKKYHKNFTRSEFLILKTKSGKIWSALNC